MNIKMMTATTRKNTCRSPSKQHLVLCLLLFYNQSLQTTVTASSPNPNQSSPFQRPRWLGRSSSNSRESSQDAPSLASSRISLPTTSATSKNQQEASSPSSDFLPDIRPVATTITAVTKDTNRHQQRTLRLPRWLPLPLQKSLSLLQQSKFTRPLLASVRFGLVAFLALEIFHAIRDVYRELQDDDDLGGGLGGGGTGNAMLSPASVKKIMVWMQQPLKERIGPPPSVHPSWVLPLAHDLKACSGVSWSRLELVLMQMTKSQANLLQTCLLRPSKRISFSAIGGVSHIKESMNDWVGSHCNTNKDNSEQQSKSPYEQLVGQGRQGMALWGPPGCGKSLLMQALAKETGWPTLVITPSLVQRKWYGESTNQVRNVFALVSLLGPCIVVLDELDGLFRVRSQDEHEVSRELKTEWLQWWDGVASSQLAHQKVLVVAATNRPWDVDPAVWRRLPQRYYVGVPNWDDRCDLFNRWAETYGLPQIHPSVVEYLSERTEGYTPSDLFHILQTACRKGPMTRNDSELTMDDVQHALNTIPPTRFSMQYIQQTQQFFAPNQQQNPNDAQGQNHQQQPQQQPQQQQQQHTSQMAYSGDGVWQTPVGNFYQFQIPVDSQVFDVLEDYWLEQQEWESSDDEEYEEESEEEEDDAC